MKILYIITILLLSISNQAQTKKQEQKKVEEKKEESYHAIDSDISINAQPLPIIVIENRGLEDENTVYNSAILQVQPEYPGGIIAFREFVTSKIKKPKIEDSNKKLKVYLSFTIEKNGSLTDVKIIRDSHNVGEQIVKAIKLSPKWLPGILVGKPVRSSFNIPISIEAE